MKKDTDTCSIRNSLTIAALMVPLLVDFGSSALAANIDSAEKYAWASQVGWVNHAPSDGGGVTVVSAGANGYLFGYAWAENIGWVGFRDTSPTPYGVRTTAFDAPPILGPTVIQFK